MADRTKHIMDSGTVWVIALGMSRSQLCRGSLLPFRGYLLRDGVVTPPRVGRLAFGGPDVPSPGNEAMAGGRRKLSSPPPRAAPGGAEGEGSGGPGSAAQGPFWWQDRRSLPAAPREKTALWSADVGGF